MLSCNCVHIVSYKLCNQNRIKSDAEKYRKIAEEYRKEEYGNLGIYYSDRFNERAEKADSRAARMVADDPSLNFLIKAIYGLFFKKKGDR